MEKHAKSLEMAANVCLEIYCTFTDDGDHVPDLDGSVRQDLPIAVPAAVGRGVVAGCGGGAYGTETCLLLRPAQVLQRNRLMVPRLETELLHSVDFHERVVKLGRKAEVDEK